MARYFSSYEIDKVIDLAQNPVNALEAVVCGNLERCTSCIMSGSCKNCPHMRRALNRWQRTDAPQNPEKPAVLGGKHVVFNYNGKKVVK